MNVSSRLFLLHPRTGLCVLALGLCGLTACGHRSRPAQGPPFVQTSIAQFSSLQPSVQLAGIVAPFENVAIQSTLSEPADAVNVQEGDTVRKGEVLAQLDTADLQAQLAADLANTSHTVYQGSLSISQGVDALRAAQAALKRDQADLQRYQALFARGYVSQQQVQAQEATVRNDQSALSSAQSTVQANGTLNSSGLQQATVAQSQAQAQQVRVSIQKATITSPIDGVVVNRNLNPGEFPGTRQIFTLQQVNPIYVVMHGSDQQVASISPGANVQITVANPHPTDLNGRVVGVLNAIVPGSTDFQVKAIFENPRQFLRPGMAVEGSVALPLARGVQIPVTALADDSHDAVLAVMSDSTLKTSHVTEVVNDGVHSIVNGLSAGTRIVTNGQSSVGDGEKISYNGQRQTNTP